MKDVIFYDYDGTVLYEYSASEFIKLTSLPANPTHEGLTSQGWNWDLTDAQAYVAAYGFLDIGQMYITDDGKTRLYISLTDENYLSPTICFRQSAVNGVTVNWGDSSNDETSSSTGIITMTHTYATTGDYVISFYRNSGNFYMGNGNNGGALYPQPYTLALYKIEVGANTQFDTGAFSSGYSKQGYINIKSVTLPQNVGTPSLDGTASLKHITIPKGSKYRSLSRYERSISLGQDSGITYFAGGNSNPYIKRLAIPPNAENIWANAFSCHNLERVILPKSIKTLNTNTFPNCHKLKEIDLSYITSIGNYAFANCWELRKVVLPSSMTYCGAETFRYDINLKSIDMPNTFNFLSGSMFRQSGIEQINIPTTSELTTIGTDCFHDCNFLKEITIPANIIEIGNSAFQSCTILNKVTILGNNLTTIGNSVFAQDSLLYEIIIPSSVTSIGTNAFDTCTSMRKYHFQSTTPPTLGNSNVFKNINADCVIYVPYSSDHSVLTAYQNETNWSTYASYIYEEPAS